MNSEMECEALPSDMIFEILTRSSLETLDQCKAVSESWKQMIYEATFLRLHTERSRCVFGYFFQDTIKNRYISALVSEDGGAATAIGGSWPSDDMRIVASSDQGLLCCEKISHKNRNHRYYVCKPATKQWQPLPNPKLRYRTAAVAIVVCKSRPLRYIIVRLSDHGTNYKCECEVFDSQTWAWEKTEAPILSYGDFIMCHNAAVVIGQSVYWLTYEDNVLAFDTNKRSFRCFRLPEAVHCNYKYNYKQLMEYEGSLGFTCVDGGRNKMEELCEGGLVFICMDKGRKKLMELWVAGRRDDDGDYWTRKMVVDMGVVRETLCCYWPIEFCNSDVALMMTDDGAAFYNVQECSFSRVNVSYVLQDAREIFRFRSDLEIIDLKCSL